MGDSRYHASWRGIQWSFMTPLEDLDFADDIALLSHRLQNMRDKTRALEEQGAKVGLKNISIYLDCRGADIGGGRVHVPREYCKHEGRN